MDRVQYVKRSTRHRWAIILKVIVSMCLDVTLAVTANVYVLLSLRSPLNVTDMASTSNGETNISVVRFTDSLTTDHMITRYTVI